MYVYDGEKLLFEDIINILNIKLKKLIILKKC